MKTGTIRPVASFLTGGGVDQYPFFDYLTKNRNVRQTQHDQPVRKGGFDRPPPLATGLGTIAGRDPQ